MLRFVRPKRQDYQRGRVQFFGAPPPSVSDSAIPIRFGGAPSVSWGPSTGGITFAGAPTAFLSFNDVARPILFGGSIIPTDVDAADTAQPIVFGGSPTASFTANDTAVPITFGGAVNVGDLTWTDTATPVRFGGAISVGDLTWNDGSVPIRFGGVVAGDIPTLRQTWAINVDNGAASVHTYLATGQADYAGATLIATDAGVYLVGGADDAGSDIRARARTGFTDFGTHLQKRLDSVDAIVEAGGVIVVKIRAVIGGEVSEYWYQSVDTTATATRERVVNVGRGLRSILWSVELSNRNSDDMDIDDVIVYPIPQTRRR